MEIQRFKDACREGARKLDAVLSGLYDDYREALLYDGYLSLGDQELARDLLQETVIKAWLKCGQFSGKSQLFPWLRQIYRHNLTDLMRRRHPEVPLSDEGLDIDPGIEQAWRDWRSEADDGPEACLRAKQSEQCFRECARRFAKDHPLAATVIRWVAHDGLDMEEVARLLRRSPGATRQYVSTCREKARVYFADWHALLLDERPGRSTSRGAPAP